MAASNVNRQKATLGIDDAVEVKMIVEKTVGFARSAREAMALIGESWDTAPYGGPMHGHFEFVIDEHLFTTTFEPMANSLVTPFDDVPVGA